MRTYRSAVSFWLVILVLGLVIAPSPRTNLQTSKSELEQGAGNQALIVLPAAWRADAAVLLAVSDLSTLLGNLYHYPVKVSVDTDVPTLRSFAVVIGDKTNVWLDALEKAKVYDPAHPTEEGYRIQRTTFKFAPVIVV